MGAYWVMGCRGRWFIGYHPVNLRVLRPASRARVLKVHSCAVDVAELVFAEAVQLVLVEAATAEEVCEDEREDRVAVVVLAVDLLSALNEILFQLPEARRLSNLLGLAFGFFADPLHLPPQRLIVIL